MAGWPLRMVSYALKTTQSTLSPGIAFFSAAATGRAWKTSPRELGLIMSIFLRLELSNRLPAGLHDHIPV